LYRFDKNSKRFLPDTTISKALKIENQEIFRVTEDSNRNIWIIANKKIGVAAYQKNGLYHFDTIPFKRIEPGQVNVIYMDKNDIVWFGGVNGLIRYDKSVKINYENSFTALIRKIITKDDSVIYWGTFWNKIQNQENKKTIEPFNNRTISLTQPDALKPVLDYRFNSLTFHYAAPSFDNEGTNKFSYILEGFDSDSPAWSAWSNETKKEYTNLYEGNYIFRVKAKNIYDVQSKRQYMNFAFYLPGIAHYGFLWDMA